MEWTAEEDAQLLDYAKKGWPASMISHKLSRTRNSVIGRMHRLRLATDPYARVKRAPRRKQTKDATQALIELRKDQCKWPIGDPLEPGFYFCSEVRKEGAPYCLDHMRACRQPKSVLKGRTG